MKPGQDFIRVLGGHAQTLIGWNDDWVEDLRGFGNPRDFEKGAFILKNSWGADIKGHSVDYLMGKISMLEERVICPQGQDAQNWIPMVPECLQKEQDPNKCMQDKKQRVGPEWRWGATELICNGKAAAFNITGFECDNDPNVVYYLSSYNSNEYSRTAGGYSDGAPASYQNLYSHIWVQRGSVDSDYMNYRVVKFNTVTKETTVEMIYDAEWWTLGNFFRPKNRADGGDDFCGYYPMPYSAMDKDHESQPQSDKDTSSVTCFDIEWDDSAYLANKDAKFNYEYLEKSTKTQEFHNYEGPFSLYKANNEFAKPHREI
jgi:hypothetical protein